MDEAFARRSASNSRSARQQENEDRELPRNSASRTPSRRATTFRTRRSPTSMPISRRRAPTTSTWAWGARAPHGARRRPRRLARLCTQQTNWHHGQRGARLVAEAQAMHDSGELRRNEYPFYPFSQDWSIFNAPFHRLPAKAQTLLQRLRGFARLAPGSAASGPPLAAPGAYPRPPPNRVALGRRNTRLPSHEPLDREIDTRRLHGRVDRPLQDRLGRGRGTLVWASGRAGRLRLRLAACRRASGRVGKTRDRRERGRGGRRRMGTDLKTA